MVQAVNQARDVVLEKLLLVRLEKADDLAAVGRIGSGKAEVERLAARADASAGP